MITVSAVGAGSSSYALDDSVPANMSADGVLAYCQIQLGDLDTQIQSQMTSQETQLHERQAVQQVQTTLQSFGTQGPTDGPGMQKCVAAFDQAIAQLGSNDPIAQQLAQKRENMMTQYGYALAPQEASFGRSVSIGSTAVAWTEPTAPPLPSPPLKPVLKNPPQNDEWQATTADLGNLVQNVKDNADIQMLTLQDLVSQRSQAVSLSDGIMTKIDQTLESQAKAIGA